MLYLAFSLLASVSILYYILSHVSLKDILLLIYNADRKAVALFVILSLSMSFFRTWRYLLLLRIAGYSPGKTAMFLVVVVRNFFSDLLPARLGTLVYIFLVNTRLGVPFSSATSSFSMAFLFDILALAPLILLAAWMAGAGGVLSPLSLIAGAFILFFITVLLIKNLPRLFELASSWLKYAPIISENKKNILSSSFLSAGQDILATREAGAYPQLLALSVMVRLAKYGALYIFLYALLHPLGYTLQDLPVSKVFLGICASELAASLPISGIGGFGIYQGTWALTFSLLGFASEMAMTTAVSHHLFTQAYGYGFGLICLISLMLPLFKASDPNKKDSFKKMQNGSFLVKISLSLTVILLLACLVLII